MDCSFFCVVVCVCVTTNCTTKWHNMANNFRVNCVFVCFICVAGLKLANIYAHKLPFWQKINSIRNRAPHTQLTHLFCRCWCGYCYGVRISYKCVWFNSFRHFLPVWLLRFIFNPRAKLSKIYNSLSHLFIFQWAVWVCGCLRLCQCMAARMCSWHGGDPKRPS